VLTTIAVGADPRGLSFSPDGDQLYVTTAASDETYIVDAATRQLLGAVTAAGAPRGISVVAAPRAGTGIDEADDDALPETPSLSAPWPNPFNARTQLSLQLPASRSGDVRLEVYDLVGQRVRVRVLEGLRPGRHLIGWDGRDARGNAVASGVYVLVVRAPGATLTRKALLLR
jgi:YVTN family beta-propeller protein